MSCRIDPDPVIVEELERMCVNTVELRWNYQKSGWDFWERGKDGRWHHVDHVYPYEFNRNWLRQLRRSDLRKPWADEMRGWYARKRRAEREYRSRQHSAHVAERFAEIGEASAISRSGRRDNWLKGYQRQLEKDFGESHDSDSG